MGNTIKSMIDKLKSYKNVADTYFVPTVYDNECYRIVEADTSIKSLIVHIDSKDFIPMINNIIHVFYHYNKESEIELLECEPRKDFIILSFKCYDYKIDLSIYVTIHGLIECEININNLYRHVMSIEILKNKDTLKDMIARNLITYMTNYDLKDGKKKKDDLLWNNY